MCIITEALADAVLSRGLLKWRQAHMSTLLSVGLDDFRQVPEQIREMILLPIRKYRGQYSYRYSDVLSDVKIA